MARYVFVGGGTQKPEGGHRPDGIAVFRFLDGKLEPAGLMDSGYNPSFLAIHPNRRFLYAVNETRDGGVSAFHIDPKTGGLVLLNRVGVGGDAPCYLTVAADGSRLLAANYSSGNLTVIPVLENGSLGERIQQVVHEGCSGSGGSVSSQDDQGRFVMTVERAQQAEEQARPERQEHAHAHSIILDPTGQYALSADLGMDRIWVYRFRDGQLEPPGDGGQTEITWRDDSWSGAGETGRQYAGVSTKPGAGPRHMTFHPNGRFLYVANELDSTVSIYSWGEGGQLAHLETLSILPEDFRRGSENTAAHLVLTPDARFLYVSNRGHDSIAGFAVDEDGGLLTPIGQFSTGGRWPRNFTIDSDGRFLLAANQYSDSVVVFAIDPLRGGLTLTGDRVSVREPMFVMEVDL